MIDRAPTLTRLAAASSAILATTLGTLAIARQSQLALAQAADSLVDVVAALLLAWTVAVARTPRDDGHPMGHTRAEALGALGVGILALLLSREVLERALGAVLHGSSFRPSGLLLAAFATKVALKVLIWAAVRSSPSPALRALQTDAKNDIGVGIVAALGFIAASYGYPSVDAWAAIPLALWIAWSGVLLLHENISLLMGAGPSPKRQQELRALASSVPEVTSVREVRAHHLGQFLSVEVQIQIAADLRVDAATLISDAVRDLLEAEPDVMHAAVLIRPETNAPPSTLGKPQK